VIDSFAPNKRRNRSELSEGPRLRSIASLVERTYQDDGQSSIRRKVMGAARFLDSLSTITGKYLDHYPVVRLAAIFYMFLLHLWVFYLFVTWNPEIHKGDILPS